MSKFTEAFLPNEPLLTRLMRPHSLPGFEPSFPKQRLLKERLHDRKVALPFRDALDVSLARWIAHREQILKRISKLEQWEAG